MEMLLAYSSCCGKVWKPAATASRPPPAVLRRPEGQPVTVDVPHPRNPSAPAAQAPAGKVA
uniref:Uncharacterized protein n=1 Tax=Oryza punctata TaxID=4537 RepID=A0A0E0LZX4_ORYPU